MPEVRTKRTHRLRPLAVDSVLLVGLLFVIVVPSSRPVAAELLANPASHSSVTASGANLVVDPPSFWMRTGANLSLQAVWSASSPLCLVAPLWFRWSVGSGNATGFLNTTTGPSATFTADSFDSGTESVAVRSGVVLDCGANETVLERSAGANVSIVVPLSLSGVVLGPNPLSPGDPATLEGTVAGGEPPYTLEVAWGDGAHSVFALAVPGTFSVNHSFAAGEFVPDVLASDSAGDLANLSVEEGISVGTGFRAAIVPASYVAEVGVPVEFSGVVEDPPLGAVDLFDCSNATVSSASPSASVPNATAFSCTFASPGTQEVLFGAYPPQPGGPSASSVLYESVVAPPEVGAELVEPVGEVGSAALVRVHLSRGALPISLAWNLSGNRSGGSEVIGSDGEGVLALPLTAAGEYALGVRATDSLGGIGTNGTATVLVDPPLEALANEAASVLSHGVSAEVAGDVFSGCPPFSWWAIPEFVPGNGSAGNGTLGTVGGFAWNGSYAREGNLSVTVGAADGCGATWQVGLVVPLVPPLWMEAAAAPGPASPNETLAVNVSIQGGWPPFRLYVNASDNESWNRTVSADGTYRWLFPTDGNGSLAVVVSVADPMGGDVGTNLEVTLRVPEPTSVSPPPAEQSGPPGNSATPSAIDGIGLFASFVVPVGIAAFVAVVWRRRSRKAPQGSSGPDPEATLKRIIEPAEGAERFTVELMAEEAGIPLSVVRSTIDRLVSEGTVRSESGADGEEVLSWSSETGR